MPAARAKRCGWSPPMRPRPRPRANSPRSPEVIVEPFGDIWLRDTGRDRPGHRARPARASASRFNGWGGKYDLPGDDTIGERLAAAAGLPCARADWILEGGAIDGDGSGTVITTEQCLLNPNRNPGMTRGDVEAAAEPRPRLRADLWLGEGLANDHTDGHVDNLARFVAPGRVAIPTPADRRPQRGGLPRRRAPPANRRARRRHLALARPGRARWRRSSAASYMNFYIGNAAVVVPQYGARQRRRRGRRGPGAVPRTAAQSAFAPTMC